MAPATTKRKRPDRQASEDDGANRPSPYKPERSGSARRTSRGNVDVEASLNGKEEMGREDGANGTSQPALLSPGDDTQMAAVVPGTAAGSGVDTSENGAGHPSKPQAQQFRYDFITTELLESWSDAKRAELAQSSSSCDEVQLSNLFSEIVRAALDGTLDAQAAGLAARDVVSSWDGNATDATALFLDTVQFLFDASYRGPPLRPILAAAGVDQQIMREHLDHALLMELGLVRNTFERMRTRKTTNLLYRQANFNLLREESEGYAKLITEYFNTAQEANRRDENPFMAEDAFQRVKALVGAFDLDVGRVLDITLDVSANLLVKAYPFFIKFYRASSWWPANNVLDYVKWEDQGFSTIPGWASPGSGRWGLDEDEKADVARLRDLRDTYFWDNVRQCGIEAFFQLGARKIVNFDAILPMLQTETKPEFDARGKETNPDKRLRLNHDKEYMCKTKTLPPSGNHDAAQLLGFKLRFYASAARDAGDTLPDNLIFLTALLIKIGFISLRDLYPHLHPLDEDMSAEQKRLENEKAEKELKDRPGGGTNALLAAGALADDSLPPPRRNEKEKEKSGAATPSQEKKEEPKEELPAPANQKLLLLKALLLIGALPEALFILGQFPWLVEVDMSIPPLLHRIAKHMLSKISESVQPLSDRGSLRESKEHLADTATHGDGNLTFTARPARRTTRWLWNDVCDKDDGYEYRHYYADWTDNVPVCQTLEDVFDLCNTFLGYLGATIGQDVILYGTILRIAHRSLVEDSTRENQQRWLELLKRQLVPALSWTKHNPALAQQVFDLLSFYPVATRYDVYFEWFKGRTSRRADVRSALARNKWEVRDVLRRISNDYVKKQSRALAKIAIASPGVVMLEMIEQLEAYSNMIPSLVECTRFFSPLAWDILTWALINSLGGQGRDRMQADGMLTSSWLQALSQFVASLFTRHSHISVAPVLQYLASELRVGNSTDLELLEQLLIEMAGVRSDMEFNDNQVIAMAGGPTLRQYILSQLSDSRHTKHKPASRLMEALGRPGLTGQVLVAIAQERQMYSSHESSRAMPLKVLGNNIDKIQAVFYQYLEVLKTNLKPTDFELAIPDAASLVADFGLDAGIALTIGRTAIRGRMEEFDGAQKQEREKSKKEPGNKQLDSKGDAEMKDASSAATLESDPAQNESGHGDTGTVNQDLEAASDADSDTSSPWHPVLEPIIQKLTDALPDLASRISIPFYVTFWTLNLYDVLVPMDTYSTTVRRLDIQITEITNDRSDVTQVAARARDSRKKSLIELRDKLKPEPSQHISDYILVKNRIGRNERFHYFPKSKAKGLRESKAENDAKHQALLQECFLPRAMMTSLDAQFSFQVLKMLHDNGTPGFSLMHLLHQLFRKQELTALIFQCTLNEAQNFGRFLSEVLKHLHGWHVDKAVYEKEALGVKVKLPGFVKTFDDNGEPKNVMDYENFRRMLFNCHAFLNGALQACFESGEYMHIRNGIVVLKAVHQVFPALKFIGKNMVDHVTKLSQEDPRQDLKLAAMSLLGPLKSRESKWVLPQAFRLNDPSKDGAKQVESASSTRPETPRAGADTPKLNATAPEFKPPLNNITSGVGRKESIAGGPEDGEIEDEKKTTKKGTDVNVKDGRANDKTPAIASDINTSDVDSAKRLSTRETSRPSSKASTPAPSHTRPAPDGPHRSESSRTSSSSLRHPPQDLASRLETGRPLPVQQVTRTSGRYPNRSDDHYGRLDRPNEARPSSREQSPGHRIRTSTPPPTNRGYHSERPFDRPIERPFRDDRPARDDGYPLARRDDHSQGSRTPVDARERPAPISRVSANHAYSERPPRTLPGSGSSDSMHGSRTGSTTPAQQDIDSQVNPQRLALINDETAGDRGGASRARIFPPSSEREPRREREGRPDDRTPRSFAQRTEASDVNRAAIRGQAEPARDIPPRADQLTDLAPTGPKRGGRLRDAPVESTYGRLNGPTETPAGPRQPGGPAGRGGRNFTAPISTRPNEHSSSSPTVSRPPEPSPMSRAHNRQANVPEPQLDRAAQSSAPSTPAAEPPVHPSRAAQFNQPPQIQTNLPAPNGPRNAGSPTSAPPSGPRGPSRANGPPTGTPTGPGPVNGLPPSGPASTQERQRRQERQRQNINATLQGSTSDNAPNATQGVNFRGASNRQGSGTFQSNAPRAAVQSVASSMEPPSARREVRQLPENAPFNPSSIRQDLFQTRPDRNEDGSRRREDNRPDRQRGSRDPSREPRGDTRDQAYQNSMPPTMPPSVQSGPNGPMGVFEGRASRGGRDDRRGHDERPSEISTRDAQPFPRDGRRGPERQPLGPPADLAGGFQPPAAEWNRGGDMRGPPRRDGPEDSRRGGRGGGQSRPEDFRRDDRSRDPGARPPTDGSPMDAGRKRRHEDGPFDATKRRRSAR